MGRMTDKSGFKCGDEYKGRKTEAEITLKFSESERDGFLRLMKKAFTDAYKDYFKLAAKISATVVLIPLAAVVFVVALVAAPIRGYIHSRFWKQEWIAYSRKIEEIKRELSFSEK